MKKTYLLFLFTIFFASQLMGQDKLKIGFVGNSITAANTFSWTAGEPWSKSYPEVCGQLCQKYFGSVADIQGFGDGGKTLVDMEEYDGSYMRTETFQRALNFAPDILFISLGTNDGTTTSWPVADGCRGYELEFYGDYLSMIDSFLLVNPETYFVLCFPPPIFAEYFMYVDTVLVKGLIPEMRRVLATTGYDSLDWHTLLTDQKALFPDNIHPNIEGSELMGKIALEKLLSLEKMRAQLGATSLLAGKTVEESSSLNATEGAMAIDNDYATFWEADAASAQSLTIDLGHDYDISFLRLEWDGADSKDYIIEVYDSTAQSWTTLYEVIGDTLSSRLCEWTEGSGSVIRLTVNNSVSSTVKLKEMQAYGVLIIPGEDITSLGGKITTQYTGSPSNESVEKFIDDNLVSKFLTFHKDAWVKYAVPAYYRLNGYTITSAHETPDRDPIAWRLSGSKDGEEWTLLDSVPEYDFPTRYQTAYRLVDDTIAYAFFKLDLSCAISTMQVGELELIGEFAYNLPPDTTTNVEISEMKDLGLYPNPATDMIYLSGLPQPAKLSVVTMAGVTLVEVVADRMDISALKPGMYFLQIESDEKVSRKPFIKL